MKKIIMALCIVLALLTAVLTPLQLAAGSKQKYISEMKLAYGTSERDTLVSQGYSYFKDNVNQGNSKEVYICYKTTENADDAICDLSMMNMCGNYSFADYEALLKNQQDNVAMFVSRFKTTINEFVGNYKIKSKVAIVAYNLLNQFIDDDTGKKLGELFVGGATDEQLQTIFFQANSDLLYVIEVALTLGCKENAGSFVERLVKLDIDADYDESLSEACEEIAKAALAMQDYTDAFEETYDDAAAAAIKNGTIKNIDEMTDEIYDAYLVSISETSKKVATKAITGWGIYKITKDVVYAKSEYSLYDILTVDFTKIHDDSEQIFYLFAPFAESFTPGQLTALECIGLDVLLTQALTSNDELAKKYEDVIADISSKGTVPYSVYLGVDRTIYSSDGVALTTAANMESYANENYEWIDGEISAETKDRLKIATTIILAGVVPMTFLILGFIAGMTVYSIYVNGTITALAGITYVDTVKEAFTVWVSYEYMRGGVSNFLISGRFIIALAVAIILITIAVVLFYYCYAQYLSTVGRNEFKDYEYTTIPKILVDYVDGKGEEDGYYLYYYAVTAADGSLGDLNGCDNKTNKYWNALYYCKDSRAGTPITENMLLSTSNIAPDGMTGVHDFEKGVEGVKSAVNLNQSSKAQDTAIYLYYTPYVESTKTASVFSSGMGMTCAFALGIVLTAGAAYVMTRKKKATGNA